MTNEPHHLWHWNFLCDWIGHVVTSPLIDKEAVIPSEEMDALAALILALPNKTFQTRAFELPADRSMQCLLEVENKNETQWEIRFLVLPTAFDYDDVLKIAKARWHQGQRFFEMEEEDDGDDDGEPDYKDLTMFNAEEHILTRAGQLSVVLHQAFEWLKTLRRCPRCDHMSVVGINIASEPEARCATCVATLAVSEMLNPVRLECVVCKQMSLHCPYQEKVAVHWMRHPDSTLCDICSMKCWPKCPICRCRFDE